MNVVARRVDAPGGADESRTTAASGVSGYKFRFFHGNPINDPDPDFFGPFRSQDPSHIGFYEIPLPPGNYTIEVESIHPEFTDGSSVGADDRHRDAGHRAGAASGRSRSRRRDRDGNDVTLVGTPPRFDQFEGP